MMRSACLTLTMILLMVAAGALCHGISVSVQPYPKTASAGQPFSISYNLDTTTQVRGYAVSIGYDTSKLSFSQATRGPLFTGVSVGWWRVNTDTLGVVHVECIIFGAGLYVTGPGNMLNLTFNALAGDYSPLQVNSLELYAVDGSMIPGVERQHGAVIIGEQPAYLNARCFLQGAYTDGVMHTQLNPAIPLTSPYPIGIVAAPSMPADVVDWVLVELRASPFENSLASQAAFLYLDGSVKSVGKPFILFFGLQPGEYHVVVRHRNHLAVMSANPFPVASSGTPNTIDLSEIGNIYERTGIMEYPDGTCAMLSGDADQDGAVYPSDRNNQWRVQNGMSGYRSADFNLNRLVTNSDLIMYWRTNAGAASAVP
jgi:hypothetical protein